GSRAPRYQAQSTSPVGDDSLPTPTTGGPTFFQRILPDDYLQSTETSEDEEEEVTEEVSEQTPEITEEDMEQLAKALKEALEAAGAGSSSSPKGDLDIQKFNGKTKDVIPFIKIGRAHV